MKLIHYNRKAGNEVLARKRRQNRLNYCKKSLDDEINRLKKDLSIINAWIEEYDNIWNCWKCYLQYAIWQSIFGTQSCIWDLSIFNVAISMMIFFLPFCSLLFFLSLIIADKIIWNCLDTNLGMKLPKMNYFVFVAVCKVIKLN